MADGILNIIQRKNPDKEFDILKQIGSGTYGEVYKVRRLFGLIVARVTTSSMNILRLCLSTETRRTCTVVCASGCTLVEHIHILASS